MTKTATQRRSSKTGQFLSVGRASDGVFILEQVPKSRHFTLGKAERVMERVTSAGKDRLASDALKGGQGKRK